MPRDRRAYRLANKEKIYARKKAWLEANREKRKAYEQAYYLANKEKYAERGKAWRAANPEKALALDRKWKANNHEKIINYRASTKEQRNAWQRKYEAETRDKGKAREAVRKWREKNGKEYHSRWRVENAGKTAFYKARRRSLKLCATPSWLTDNDWRKIDSIYAKAAKTGMDVDHIIPIQGKLVCGLHVPSNLQLLTPNENKAKSNRLPPEHECIATLSAGA